MRAVDVLGGFLFCHCEQEQEWSFILEVKVVDGGDEVRINQRRREALDFCQSALSLSSISLPTPQPSHQNDCFIAIHSINNMVLLVTTSRILSALESISPPTRQHLNLPATLTLETPISHDQLVRLSRHLRSDDDGYNRTWSLNALLQGTKVYVPPPPPKPEPVYCLHYYRRMHRTELMALASRLNIWLKRHDYSPRLRKMHTTK